MTDANRAYDTLIAFGSALRMGVNFTASVLQALVLKGILSHDEAEMVVADAKQAALGSTAATAAQLEVAEGTFGQVLATLRQTKGR
jgi:hypothetical protein